MSIHPRSYWNVLAVLIVVLYMLLLLLLTGCTTYTITRTPQMTEVKVKSTRSFEAPVVSYSKRGDNVDFNFGADAVTQPGPDDYARGVIGGIEMFKKSNVCVAKNRIDERIGLDNRPDEFTTGYIAGMTRKTGQTNINGLRCQNGEMPSCSCP
jgi:hypothetical protein